MVAQMVTISLTKHEIVCGLEVCGGANLGMVVSYNP
jgi:hypothetical protein